MPKLKQSPEVTGALAYLDEHLPDFQQTLAELTSIPSVSAEGFPPEEVERSAESVAHAMRRCGLSGVEILKLPGVHPYAYGEWLKAPGAPTVLLYAHHDVMPPGRPEKWLSPPWELSQRKGRLYGRGSVDDKAGIVTHLAAIESFLETAGKLPVNVKFIVEGEEETGSENLGKLLEKYREKFGADFLVLNDTGNLDSGVPSLISVRPSAS